MATSTEPAAPERSSAGRLLLPLAVALAVGGAVYVVAQSITPDVNKRLFGQSATDTFALKAWLATGVLALAAFQLYSALWIYGRLPWRAPAWLGRVHRASGVAAIVLSLPIAYHCLLAYGFRDFDRRTVVHSLAGCFFYGAFAAKVIVVRWRRLPGWALPAAGGTLLTLVVVLWYSAALWYFDDFNSPGLSQNASTATGAYSTSSTGGGQGGTAPSRPGPDAVAYRGIAIQPAGITVRSGATITWTNYDSTVHNVAITSGPKRFSSPAFDKGGTYRATFTKPGVYRYLCTYHPATMKGTVRVLARRG